ncbi:DUF676 domain-containing protein/DUF3657 domain-containing protein [Cephalotus follicularis]|uniref:DUF676 domain-containing protein/DUF3657 domain-containing protein n=1 Tax=Cephalotus follicularis TaxID=3775 RepID=A0A1Q3BH73_CEPFO|nr:DUF676 domain-containing protein/DUF3657 domain-containing protein [Cephalotus follicularis]
MFRRIRLLIDRNSSTKKRPNVRLRPHQSPLPSQPQPPPDLIDSVHEIAIYIHRFHNLDLFQQGWYQIKISMKCEDSEYSTMGIPSRVVQYEVPELGSEDTYGVWRIDDMENSFTTQPFRIRYARQDVYLSIMISFNLSLGKCEGPSTSAVILKFELMYTPVLNNGSEFQESLDACPAAVHTFRIPPKALLGLHSYCPIHFDALHAVLVDISVHISLLKSDSSKLRLKVPSDSSAVQDVAEDFDRTDRSNFRTHKAFGQVASLDSKQVMLIEALVASRDTLLNDIQNISKAIDQAIDLRGFTSKLHDADFSSVLQGKLGIVGAEGSGKLSVDPQNGVERAHLMMDFRSNGVLHSLSREDILNSFHTVGNQISYLWNTFLVFHRANKTKILEHLCDTWANDRRAEWSIWMVYSKVEMPHRYMNSGVNEASHRGLRGKALSLRRLSKNPAQNAAMRAEMHRRSIAQMKINNGSLQDLYIFGDPSHIPIVVVEHVMNGPQRTMSGDSYFSHFGLKDTCSFLPGSTCETAKKLPEASLQQNGCVLKVAVFVHGFQGHHLDLRLVRNQWLLIDPKIECLMSEVNEDKTYGDFREMGLRLAEEVISFVKKKMDKVSRKGNLRNIRLSFVGHSIGNVIIRTALAESIMEPYLRYLYTYVSISGPHLGYLYSSNSLFNSGLWVLKKLKGTQCIHQLTFSDDPDLQNTFFYKLCKQKTLENFANIILLSSPQDGYVPYHSARIEMCQASFWDSSKKGKVFLEMLNDCLDQIRAPSSEHRVFMRCDVNFDTSSQGRNLNTIIGRAAHIEFLESDIFARFIMWSFPELFR